MIDARLRVSELVLSILASFGVGDLLKGLGVIGDVHLFAGLIKCINFVAALDRKSVV